MINRWMLVWAGVLGMAWAFPAAAQNKAPVIEHYPVTMAVRGQPFFVRAQVADDSGRVKSVTLYYSTSRDAAPFKIPLQDSGTGTWYGSIPENMFSNAAAMTYYVEAMDELDAATETPWYKVSIKTTASTPPVPPGPAMQPVPRGNGSSRTPRGKPVVAAPTAPPAETDGERPAWVKPTLIAGGAVLLIGGGYAIANSGGGGGGGGGDVDGGANTVTNFGTYVGSQTTCFQEQGSSAQCDTGPASITVAENGLVTSDDLRTGQRLETMLSGSSFVFNAPVNEGGRTGNIQYSGTVLDRRIVGSIQGSAQTATGSGTYTGTFNAALP